ncbi:MAG: hypothetical protein NT031_19910, partial [Planctomycetota bacterium]|nr:hypothetical protein [Planctomycetota bacterium]
MTDLLAQVAAWLSAAANAMSEPLAGLWALMPGWLSCTLVSAVMGVVMLVAFKYTSNQAAIRRVRDDIKANLLAVKLFPDSIVVTLRAQGRLLRGAVMLLVLAVAPMLVMIVPMSLVLGQMGLWYQSRPLRAGEEAVVTMTLAPSPGQARPDVKLAPTPAAEVLVGPVRIVSRNQVCWNLCAKENGYHRLAFRVDGRTVEKEFAVGDGIMRVSVERPDWDWSAIVLNPAERPFERNSPVRAIRIDYPDREAGLCGADWWVAYCFAAS